MLLHVFGLLCKNRTKITILAHSLPMLVGLNLSLACMFRVVHAIQKIIRAAFRREFNEKRVRAKPTLESQVSSYRCFAPVFKSARRFARTCACS